MRSKQTSYTLDHTPFFAIYQRYNLRAILDPSSFRFRLCQLRLPQVNVWTLHRHVLLNEDSHFTSLSRFPLPWSHPCRSEWVAFHILFPLCCPQSLSDPNNYHEFCRLLARLKSNYQLGELVKVENYPEVIRLIANFTVTSLQVCLW